MNNLLIHLLTLLRDAGDCLCSERQLRVDLRVRVTPAPTGAEINEAFSRADSLALAISSKDELTRDVKWRITELGRSKLAESKL